MEIKERIVLNTLKTLEFSSENGKKTTCLSSDLNFLVLDKEDSPFFGSNEVSFFLRFTAYFIEETQFINCSYCFTDKEVRDRVYQWCHNCMVFAANRSE